MNDQDEPTDEDVDSFLNECGDLQDALLNVI